MIYPVIIAIADWLKDDSTGPNAYIPAAEPEAKDAGVSVPRFKCVLNPFTDREAFANEEPGRYPALLVTPASPVEVDGEVNQDQLDSPSFTVQLRVVVEDIEGPRGLIVMNYLIDAVNEAMSAFLADTPAGSAARTRRHVQIISCTGRSYALAYEAIGAAKVGAVWAGTFFTRHIEAA